MGTYYNGSIENFSPDNTPDTLYIDSCNTPTMGEIMQAINKHFGGNANLNNFSIEAEYIHTHCIGYNRYDPGDYTNYIVIRRIV